jgi:threonine/homoserine/homoserine lactone efflux protein
VNWLTQLESPANALAVLTAMITPAVLISACGALIFSTASRLGRVIDRVRFLSARFEELARNPQADEMATERLPLLHAQLERQTTRARLIQRALVAFYTALGVFVATSLAIAVLNAVARNYLWMAVTLGLLGSMFMLYGSLLLIVESRMALAAIISEIEFLSKVSRKYAGEGAASRLTGGPFTWLGRRIG